MGVPMPHVKKSSIQPKLDAYERDIEKNLLNGKPLSASKKMLEINKLKAAAKQKKVQSSKD